jgi:cysteine desulfurase / selenocysteine lyase
MQIKTKFEFFRRQNLIYLDSSATTQAPDQVINAVDQVLQYRGNPHRGAHRIAKRNEEILEEARNNVALFVNAKKDEVVFTNNTTDSINLAVDAIADHIKKGDEIIASVVEHHSNMIPYLKLVKRGAVIRIVGIKDGQLDMEDLKSKLSARTKIVALHHCSNVLGNINPVEKIGTIIKKHNSNILYFVDGAQAVAHIPVDIRKIKCDFYAFSGHKMYGPDGIGVLIVNKKIHPLISKVRSGGGVVTDVAITYGKDKDIISSSYDPSMIVLEGGTPNTSNIVSLSKAINFIRAIGFDEIQKHERDLTKKIIAELEKIEELTVFGPKNTKDRIGVISFGTNEYNLKEMGDYLDKRKICIRYGAHCAFPLVDVLGQESIRISLGCYSDENDIDTCLQEIKTFIDKKKGLIINPELEPLRNKIYYQNLIPVNNKNFIIHKIKNAIYNPQETEVVIMAGHFLGIPDTTENRFWPSIKSMLPKRLHPLLEEFGMTTFPLFTWEFGCQIVKELKANNIKAKLVIIGNDTTGINELRLTKDNVEKKTAKQYRDELINQFQNSSIPKEYLDVLEQNGLKLSDIVKNKNEYLFRESFLRDQFKQFIRNNKDYFSGIIDYSADEKENIDVSIGILDNQQIENCRFDTFQSKTGGKFCIVELTQLLSEIFGKSDEVSFDYVSKRVLNPKSKANHKMMVMLTPAMCDNAVTRSAELYIKLMLQEKGEGSFKFLNIPFGPESARSLATGSEVKYLSDKDNIEELDIDYEPDFGELWRLSEYQLLYDSNDYLEDMENLFKKIRINKKSKLLDTCVGPGFFSTELLEKGYNLKTADKSKKHIKPFLDELKAVGIKHQVTNSTWLDLGKHFPKQSFDLLFNRGNTFIYANGGFIEKIKISREETLKVMKQTLKVYYDLLKTGGYLYVDKFKDSEVPAEKIAARLNIKESKQKKDIVFYVEKKPEDNARYARVLLRDSNGQDSGSEFTAYDLTEGEMEKLLQDVGFKKIKKINLTSERHFVVWLAQK